MNNDLVTMKLHTANDGNIWTLFADQRPKDTQQTLIPFMLSAESNKYHNLRVMGCSQNAHLLLGLYRRRIDKQAGCLEVCSPAACRTAAERRDPARTLIAMRQFERTSSTGGWHIFKNIDQPTYAIVSYVSKMPVADLHLRRLVRFHPIWPALSFIPHINTDICGLLLAEIIDPRWFVDLRHPSRGSRLRAYLGLDLKTLQGVLGKGPRCRLHTRCQLVLNSWHNTFDPKMIERPDHFLYRIARFWAEKGKEDVGLLRASQTFIEYLRLTWLARIGCNGNQTEALFVPGYFFADKNEVQAFGDHLQKAIKDD